MNSSEKITESLTQPEMKSTWLESWEGQGEFWFIERRLTSTNLSADEIIELVSGATRSLITPLPPPEPKD